MTSLLIISGLLMPMWALAQTAPAEPTEEVELSAEYFEPVASDSMEPPPQAVPEPEASSTLDGMKYAVPVGTVFTVALNTELNSEDVMTGDRLQVVLKTPLLTPTGYAVAPAGSRLNGEIREVREARMPRVEGKVFIRFYEAITPEGEVLPLQATINSEDGYLEGNRRTGRLKSMALNSAIKQTVALTAGAAAGYGVGAALFVVAKKGKDVALKPGDEFELRLDETIFYAPNPAYRSISTDAYAYLSLPDPDAPIQMPRMILYSPE